jgi:hypothetical protein
MKLIVLILVVTAAVASATDNTDYQAVLTTIDAVPTKPQIDQAFDGTGMQPLDTLRDLAIEPDPVTSPVDPGIRLRAIHALAKYCTSAPCASTDPAHQAVITVLQQTQNATSGKDVLFLRAAIETLGLMKVSSDVTPLLDQLNHPSRDVRAATARALRDLCNPQAILPLRARYSSETTDQVKLAISEALRILGQCQPN